MWEDLPYNIKPHLVIDPWGGRSLAIIQLATPVLTGEGSRLGPQFLVNLAHEMMASYFEATALPHSNVVKNPWDLRATSSERYPDAHSSFLQASYGIHTSRLIPTCAGIRF